MFPSVHHASCQDNVLGAFYSPREHRHQSLVAPVGDGGTSWRLVSVSHEAVIAACTRCASPPSPLVLRVLRHMMMMAKPSIRFLLLSCLLSSTTARSFSRDDTQHGFPQLHARNDTGLTPSSINGTLTNSTGAALVSQIPLACNFTQEVTFKVGEQRRTGIAGLGHACTDQSLQAIETNCSAYINVLESSSGFPLWERWQSSDRFSNCTYHEIATRFPDVPNSLPQLVFRQGKFEFISQPDMADARRYMPLPPLELAKRIDGDAHLLPVRWHARGH